MNSPPQQRPPGADDAALQAAAFALQGGRFAEVERISGELLAKNPGDARAAQLFAFALIAQKRGAEAIAPLERAAQANENPALDTQLGLALAQAGRKDEALDIFARAIKRTPPFPPAFLEYGNLLIDTGRTEEALGALKQGLALAPNFIEIFVQLGRAHAIRGEREEAQTAFARVLANPPRDPQALFDLARLMKHSACFTQAAEAYRKMLALDPGVPAGHIGLGTCLLEIGDTAGAFENLRAASSAGPKAFGQSMRALAFAGHGRFWIRRSDAERALKGDNGG